MSLWNPMTVFSRPPIDGPTSGYDPTRTGDPLRANPGRPGVGYGEAYVGRTSTVYDQPRNPIGFAPPQEAEVHDEPARFRTEISFRRHHEAPRASAVSDPTDSPQPSWDTPAAPAPLDDMPSPANVSFDEIPEIEDAQPFYRREISFRRKKAEPAAVEEALDAVDEAPEVEAPVEIDEPVAEIEPEIVAEAVLEDAPEALQLDEPEAELFPVEEPVGKRRFGFRRKAVAEIEQAAPEVEAEVEAEVETEEIVAELEPELVAAAVVEDAPEALHDDELVTEEPETDAVEAAAVSVPFYKRELGFRRKTTVEPELDATDSYDADSHDADPFPAEVLATAVVLPVVEDEPAAEPEPVAEIVEEWPAEAVDEPVAAEFTEVELEPEHEAEPEVVDAEPADEPSADEPAFEDEADATDDLPVADATVQVEEPSSNGRFSRKAKPPKEKASKKKGQQPARSRKVVGLKIGASQIAAAVVQTTEAGHELLELARRPLAEGIVVDGDVRDELALSNALKSFFEEAKLPKTDVRVGLSSNRIGVRTIEMEWIDDPARFDNAVRFKAHEVLPVALNESMLDYRVLSSRVDEDGQELRRVLLVVAPRDQVEPYQRVAERAGIRLAGADLEALALLRAFVDPTVADGDDTPETATVAVSIGHESSTLLVAGNGACEFTRVFDWGGSELEDSIATTLDVRPVEAAMILRHLSLSGPGRQYDTLDELSRAKATDAVRQRLTPFARELVNSLQFYQTQESSLGIGRILITGGTSHLEGLDAALHQMIGVDVSVGDPFARVMRADEYDPAIEATIGSMTVPIGLAIDEEAARGVNLLPKVTTSTRDTKATLAKVAVPVAVAIPFAALALLYTGAHGSVSDRQAELQTVKVQIDSLPKPAKPVLETGVVGDEAARATAVANLLGGRVAWDGVFNDLARILPENVWLTSMSVSQPGADSSLATAVAAPKPLPGQPAATPTAVSIEGYTYSQPDVALLLARLATLPSLQRVTLSSSAAELVGDKPAVHFVIVADLSQPGGAS